MESDNIIINACTNKDWVDYLSALLVPTIAIIGSILAYFQLKINSSRLKHELFDRRYVQYEVVGDFLGSIMSSGKSKPEEQYKYMIGTKGLRFIFNIELKEYLDKNIWKPAIDLECLESELEGVPAGEERSKNVKKQGELKKKLYKEFESLGDTFEKYLQLLH